MVVIQSLTYGLTPTLSLVKIEYYLKQQDMKIIKHLIKNNNNKSIIKRYEEVIFSSRWIVWMFY